MNSKLLRLIAIVTVLAFAAGAQAQRRNSRYVDYINKYSALAVQQMKEHKIPASITLAQGLLESGAGMASGPPITGRSLSESCSTLPVQKLSYRETGYSIFCQQSTYRHHFVQFGQSG